MVLCCSCESLCTVSICKKKPVTLSKRAKSHDRKWILLGLLTLEISCAGLSLSDLGARRKCVWQVSSYLPSNYHEVNFALMVSLISRKIFASSIFVAFPKVLVSNNWRNIFSIVLNFQYLWVPQKPCYVNCQWGKIYFKTFFKQSFIKFKWVTNGLTFKKYNYILQIHWNIYITTQFYISNIKSI